MSQFPIREPTNFVLFSPAPLFRRFAALVYDSFVIFSLLMLSTAIALWCNRGQSLLSYRFFFLLYLIATTGLFVSWCWTKSGQTLGMLAWRLKVVDQHYQPLTWRRAFWRYLLAMLSLGCAGLGLLWCLFDKNKQSLHDKLSRTQIISTALSSAKKGFS